MGRVIKLILLANLGSCITVIIIITIANSFKVGLSVGLLTFGNIFLPTIGAVLVYFLIKRRTTLPSTVVTLVLQATLLIGLLILGLLIWATGEAAIFYDLNCIEIEEVFVSEFKGFLPVVFTEAILIPTLDLLLSRRSKIIKA